MAPFAPVAIVGLGGAFPGARTLEDFYDLIAARASAVSELEAGDFGTGWTLQPSQLLAQDPLPDRMLSVRACVLRAEHEPAGFAESLTGAPRLEPVYRHTARAAASAINGVEYDPERTGVVLAAIALPTDQTCRLSRRMAEGTAKPTLDADLMQALQVTSGPARWIARQYGLRGRTLTLDAACASSLYALKLACDDLHAGRADAMLAGGVSRPDWMYVHMGFSQLRALSPTGRCAPFDRGANGLVVGEGAGVVVLKLLDRARLDGDRILGVIRGIGLSNDRQGALLAPDSAGQVRAMHAAYASAGWTPADVDLVECHGTGTPLGDAIETASLRQLFASGPPRARSCAIGSVKSNVGHLLTAAGMASLSKVLLALERGILLPSANFDAPEADSSATGESFHVQQNPEPWPDTPNRPRRAAVSGFGFGGINAHLLVEEFREEAPDRVAVTMPRFPRKPVAIVGVGICGPGIADARAFWELCMSGGALSEDSTADPISITAGRFRIPPAELRSLLPQQLLFLLSGDEAFRDAGLAPGDDHERTAILAAMELDLNTTNYALRWQPMNSPDASGGAGAADTTLTPLDATRVIGSLGNIVASRLAKEYGCGGPSFALSDQETGALQALEMGAEWLRSGETDTVLVGAVELTGDPRHRYLDDLAERTTPGQRRGGGAVTLVLQRLADAERAGRRILAVIEDAPADGSSAGLVELASLRVASAAARDARIAARTEATQAALSCAEVHAGYWGTAGPLLSVAKAALHLRHRVLGPLPSTRPVPVHSTSEGGTWTPRFAEWWLRDRAAGARRALVASPGRDATLSVLELREGSGGETVSVAEREPALFALTGTDVPALARGAEELITAGARTDRALTDLAREWESARQPKSGTLAAVLLAESHDEAVHRAKSLLRHLRSNAPAPLRGEQGLWFTPEPLGPAAQIAFVFPGSGNHYVGMGRRAGVRWPAALERLDAENLLLRSQMMPRWYTPRRTDWSAGWEARAYADLCADPQRMIYGTVSHGTLMSDILADLGVRPQAVIGYSLGESTGFFALRAWRDRDGMLGRMLDSPLFRTELAGQCNAAARAWGLFDGEPVAWRAAVVAAPAEAAAEVIKHLERVYLLIVNTSDECVIGGEASGVQKAVSLLETEAFYLEGVPTVHCPIVREVEYAYQELHRLEVTPPDGVRFYSVAHGRPYHVTTESAAESVLRQALHGFNFPAVIERAYADGVRLFVEPGPQASCSRMIGRILDGRRHFAQSASLAAEDEAVSVLKVLAGLVAERAVENLARLYQEQDLQPVSPSAARVAPGTTAIEVSLAAWTPPRREPLAAPEQATPAPPVHEIPQPSPAAPPSLAPVAAPAPAHLAAGAYDLSPLAHAVAASASADRTAHERYLVFAQTAQATLSTGLQVEMQALSAAAQLGTGAFPARTLSASLLVAAPPPPPRAPAPAQADPHSSGGIPRILDRDQCLEFARGSIGAVLGTHYAAIDAHPTRVRLPDEPLMLVDRITAVEGEPFSLASGRVVTEHDVLPGAWYLDAGRAPISISVESGQADLFLSAFLGIDTVTLGERVYRLLDAEVTFHRGLPRPGETIQYDIRILRFIRQADTYLFFFEFDGTIGGQPLLTMRNGCAGFFTHEEIAGSGGIIETPEELAAAAAAAGTTGLACADAAFVPVAAGALDAAQVNAIAAGRLHDAFGGTFATLPVAAPLTLPSGLLRLIHRVPVLDPAGGRFGRGFIRAEMDVHPDDWFLTCHFVDDMVMPGTLMYECAAHALRILLLRMGWVVPEDSGAFEPILGAVSMLRCRGPVTCATRVAAYEVHVRKFGFDPEPYVLADTVMFADEKAVVKITGMSLKLTGATHDSLAALWAAAVATAPHTPPLPQSLLTSAPWHGEAPPTGPRPAEVPRERIVALAIGKPSDAFGEPYRVFDEGRRVARLPGPPYQFLDRITRICTDAFSFRAGGWIEAQFDYCENDWYFRADGTGTMPYAVLLETALQPCGWLAAFLGSSLRVEHELFFRNLGGRMVQHAPLLRGSGCLTTRVSCTSAAEAAGMILEDFALELYDNANLVLSGTTSFGFFTETALSQQAGLRGVARLEQSGPPGTPLPVLAPLTPACPDTHAAGWQQPPARVLRMIEEIVARDPSGGAAELGTMRARKIVDPAEWFFAAHFYQDPVMPGSLGLEAFLQLLRYEMGQRFPGPEWEGARFETIVSDAPHEWTYRGQVRQQIREMVVEAEVTAFHTTPAPLLVAKGTLFADGLPIYAMKDFAVRLVPSAR